MAPRSINLPKLANGLLNRPTGITGRHRPFYFLNLVDRARGANTLETAVHGKIILITGASSGIGEAAARRIGAAGGELVLVARSADKLEELAGEIEAAGGQAHAFPCDLTDFDAIDATAATVLERFRRVDVLVNNAGRSIRRSVDLSYDRFHDFERTMQLNYFAPLRLILATLPAMRAAGGGQIVNVSSAGVPVRTPRFSAYVASKAALDAFSDCLAAEVAHDDIRITSILMPLVRTPMIAPTGVYKNFPALSPEQAAERVAQAIIYKPRRIGTPFGSAASVADAVSPTSLDAIRAAGYQLFPDSRAARGGKPRSDDDAVSRQGSLFAKVFGGIHW